MTPIILIVDDVKANRDTLSGILESPDYRLMEAPDGMTALTMASKTPPDLVLLDIMMPEMDGFEVCRRLRADPALAEVPVVMVTALDDQQSRLTGIEAGADDFITKPFNRIELRARVRTITRLNRYRRIQEATQRIQEQAALIDLAPDAIIVCNLGQRITLWNPAAERMYGWHAEEAIGQCVNELLFRDQDQDRPVSVAIVNDGWRREATHVTRDGREIIVASHRKLLRRADGQPKAVLMINSDLTGKKKLEEQLLRSQRLESIGTLATGIAHDLNNVFSPIVMSVGVLRMPLADKDKNEMLDIVESCAQRGDSFVRQILDFARGTESKKAEVELPHLLETLVQMFRGAFPSGIKIKTNVARDLWPVVGNSTQIDQVIMNLCLNARDAMPSGGELRVSMENVTLSDEDCLMHQAARPEAYVCIKIADTGTGMPPDVLSRIFDAFFTTKADGKGTGLGLATVQTVVSGHGGFITVESKVGTGTAFKVYLPAIPTTVDIPVESVPPPPVPVGNGECLLVVEDMKSDQNAETTGTILGKYGYRPLQATDGFDALQLFVEYRNDIRMMITDVDIPEIGGPGLAQFLRGLDPKLPILLIGHGQREEELLASGCITEFVKKPYAVHDLLTSVQGHLLPGERELRI